MTLAWRVAAGGFVEVDGRGVVRGFAAEIARARAELGAPIWLQSWRCSIPLALLLATAAVEGGGNAHPPNGSSGEVGPMQLMPINWQGLTAAQVAVPAENVRISAEMLMAYDASNGGCPLAVPKIASCYNAGSEANGTPHARASDPWGMAESPGYIDKIVRAWNEAVAQVGPGIAPPNYNATASQTSSSSSSSSGVPLPVLLMIGKLAIDEFGGR